MKSGSALVLLLLFTSVAITITTAATVLTISSTQSSSAGQISQSVLSVAESGAENALLRLLRNPGYSGETLTVGDGQATINVTGTSPYTIVSTGRIGSHTRTVQVTASYVGGILTVGSWSEIYP
jgi:hypothetical protein